MSIRHHINSESRHQQGKTIYDIGANNGDDLAYYLTKGLKVVAVEANPTLCNLIHQRFRDQIANGRLAVENCVVTADPQLDPVPFYIHKDAHILSQLPKPKHNINDFEEIILPALSANELIKRHGEPHYIKIDIEHYDHVLLRSLFKQGIRPEFISAECHSLDVFIRLLHEGGYNSFKVVDGFSVSKVYKNTPIATLDGIRSFSFPFHSAGPFGVDLHGEWMDGEACFKHLIAIGLGWKDLHACVLPSPVVPSAGFHEGPGQRPQPIHELLLRVRWACSHQNLKRALRRFTPKRIGSGIARRLRRRLEAKG